MSYEIKKNRDEEKVFSVTMTEEELSLFSEFLEQREYARMDYNGLTKLSRKNLNIARNVQARRLKSAKRHITNSIDNPTSQWEKVLDKSKSLSSGLRKKAEVESAAHRKIDKDYNNKTDLRSKISKGFLKGVASARSYLSPGSRFL